MDRMIHTALNTLNNLYMNRAVKSQNLSNLNVPGFRRDMGTTFSSGFLTEDKGLMLEFLHFMKVQMFFQQTRAIFQKLA